MKVALKQRYKPKSVVTFLAVKALNTRPVKRPTEKETTGVDKSDLVLEKTCNLPTVKCDIPY